MKSAKGPTGSTDLKLNIIGKASMALMAAVCFVVLSGCSTTQSQDDGKTNAGNYVRRAERIADAMPRGSGN